MAPVVAAELRRVRATTSYHFMRRLCLLLLGGAVGCADAAHRSVIEVEPVTDAAYLHFLGDTLVFNVALRSHNTTADTLFFACEPLAVAVRGDVYASWASGLKPCTRARLRILPPNTSVTDTSRIAIGTGDVARTAFATWKLPARFRVTRGLFWKPSDALQGGGSGRGAWTRPFTLDRCRAGALTGSCT